MKKAFSFVEVLISVVILAFLGTAMFKFNSFNKRAMEKNLMMQDHIMLSSSLLYNKDIDNNKKVNLLELTSFVNLHDDDRKFLKSIELSAKRNVTDKLFLYNDGKDDSYMEYGDLEIKYKNQTINYLWMQEADEKK